MNKIRDYIYSLAKENDIAIHCPNKEDIEELVEILGCGGNWGYYWERYKENGMHSIFCVSIKCKTKEIAWFNTSDFYINNNHTIHEFTDIKAKFTDQTLAELLGVEENIEFELTGKIYSAGKMCIWEENIEEVTSEEAIKIYLNRHLIKQDKTPQWSEETKEQAKGAMALFFKYVTSDTQGVVIWKETPEKLSNKLYGCENEFIHHLPLAKDNEKYFTDIPLGTCWALKDIVGEE
jgi:hypothetical protein